MRICRAALAGIALVTLPGLARQPAPTPPVNSEIVLGMSTALSGPASAVYRRPRKGMNWGILQSSWAGIRFVHREPANL